jgi:hypothetical protein
MPIAFAIVAHRNPEQVVRLVRTIRRQSDAPIVVHLDRKAHSAFAGSMAFMNAIPDVVAFSKVAVSWGNFSVVEAVLEALRVIEARFPGTGHVMHLSGQDYPIKPIAHLEHVLAASPEQSFVDYAEFPRADWANDAGGFARVEHFYLLRTRRGMIRLPLRRRMPPGVTFYGGSAFWCLAPRHRRFVLDDTHELQKFLHGSLIPDEIFFQTALLNGPFAAEVSNQAFTYTKWLPGAASPMTLGCGDLERLAQSPAYFARKFDSAIDQAVLDRLDVLVDTGGRADL